MIAFFPEACDELGVKILRKILSIFDYLLDGMAFLAGIILVFIMLSVCVDVIMRYFFSRPLIWVTEITEALLLYITFLGTAWLLRKEGHVKVDIIFNRLSLRTRSCLGVIGSLIGIVISLSLIWYGFYVTWDYYQRGIYDPTALELPLAAVIIIIPIGGLMLFVQFLRRTWKYVEDMLGKDDILT